MKKTTHTPSVTVIGAGLAGCEAAMAIAQAGIPVTLIEMKPHRYSPAHHSADFAELVCSNSLKAARVDSASGLLKAEMRQLDSVCMRAADACPVPAGGALAVDREAFSARITAEIIAHPLISVEHREVNELPAEGITVVATGPLTADALAADMENRFGKALSFYDAAAPIITAASLDRSSAFCASRYGDGEGDYWNCPLNKEEYTLFRQELVGAQRALLHEFDKCDVYEGCMPIEILASRGEDAARFGPMKPVGLRDPHTGHRPWAVVQLRQENVAGDLLGLVGFQTNLTFAEQKRVFGLIPALKNAEYARYGVMHRNTFLDSPRLLTAGLSLRDDPRLLFAGQLTGVEGYMESAAAGIVAGKNAVRLCRGLPPMILPRETMIGALLGYISDPATANFQPMGANFGILPPLSEPIRDKKARYAAYADRALAALKKYCQSVEK